jgi:predicted metal-dependent phosphotriesterase family hydrolase
MMAPIHMTVAQMREAAALGAYIEFVFNGLIGPYKEFDFADYAKAIREVGVQSVILAGDLGQPVNPVHPDGLKIYFAGLKKAGFRDADIAVMSRDNPAKLLEQCLEGAKKNSAAD